MAYNKPLLNTRQTFVLMFIVLSLLFWNVLRASSHSIKTADFLRIPLFVYIIFPISGLFGRITFTKFILREVKNFFGNLWQFLFDWLENTPSTIIQYIILLINLCLYEELYMFCIMFKPCITKKKKVNKNYCFTVFLISPMIQDGKKCDF